MLKKTIEIVGKVIGVRPETITEKSRLQQDLNMDRTDMFSILTDLEDEYSIVIDYNLASTLKTVEDLESIVNHAAA